MGTYLKRLTIRGFKSIQELDAFELRDLNVLIGANGAGKTNFVDFFRLLRAVADEGLKSFVTQEGGDDGVFFVGHRETRRISARLEFCLNAYEFELEPSADGNVQIVDERVQSAGEESLESIGEGSRESALRKRDDENALSGLGRGLPGDVFAAVSRWMVYHFHDTRLRAAMRLDQPSRDFEMLRPDASNIAAFLMRLREMNPSSYTLVRDTVRLIAPFFDDFLLRPKEKRGEEKLRLEWRQKGSDFPFQPSQLSDGTLRFICLATALLQPRPPTAIVIDEPELGLHPYAITLLAELIHSAATRTQVVVSTQSPTLLDHFAPDDIVVVTRQSSSSTFERLDPGSLAAWLEKYSVGELWQKNVVGGRPRDG